MKVVKVDLTQERKVVTNFIVSDQFVKELAPVTKPQLFRSSYAKLVVGWVLEYYEHFKQAPGKNIKDLFQSKAEFIQDEDTKDSIAEFLTRLSKDWEATKAHNIEFSIKQGYTYLKTRSLDQLKDSISNALLEGNIPQAEQLVGSYSRLEPSLGEGVSILKDSGRVSAAFMEEEEVLFSFPGALGLVVGKFSRGDFLGILAPMKRGKTWLMWYVAECAMLRSLKVVFFTLEMTENQMIRRSWQALTGLPKEKGEVKIPYFETMSEGAYEILSKTEEREKLDPSQVKVQQDKMRRLFRGGDVKIISLPAYSATVDDLELHLDNLAHYDNFEADVVVVDYADIVAPSKGIKDARHQLDDTWKRLRRMAQARDMFVCTASQAAKVTFERDVSQLDVAEDIRKLAHVTHMMALNQTPEESEQGIIRVSQIAIREGRKVFDQAVVLQCLDIGKTYLDSRLASQVPAVKEIMDRKQGKKKSGIRL